MKRLQDNPNLARVVCGLLVAFTIAHFFYYTIKVHWICPPSHFNIWYIKAQMIRESGNIYGRVSPSTTWNPFDLKIDVFEASHQWRSIHPPPFYALLIPLTFLPIHLAGFLWRLFSLAALGMTG